MTDRPRYMPKALHNHPALDGSALPRDAVQRHIWMLDVLRQLHQYATTEGLATVADHVVAASEALLSELRDQFHASSPAGEPAGA